MAIKCLALDLDRTTLNKDGKLSMGNRKALEEVILAGIHVIIASGRAYDTLPADVIALPGIQYAVTCNGAAMYHIPTGKCMKRIALSSHAVEALMQVTEGEDVTYEAFIDGIAYAGRAYVENPVRFGATPQAVHYVQSTRKPEEDIVGFIHKHKEHLDSMDIIVKDEVMKAKVWDMIQKATDEVYITSSIRQLIEVSDRHCGKKSGVSFFLQKLGLKREELAAFGDADNDIDMLQYAGCGIAMENASKGCKQAADYITRHHDEDGLAYAIYSILKLV